MTTHIDLLTHAAVNTFAIGTEGEVLAIKRDTSDRPWQVLTHFDAGSVGEWLSHDELLPYAEDVMSTVTLAAAVSVGRRPEAPTDLGSMLARYVNIAADLATVVAELRLAELTNLLALATAARDAVASLQSPPKPATRGALLESDLQPRPIRDEPQA